MPCHAFLGAAIIIITIKQSVIILFRQLHQGNGSPAPSVSAFDGQELLKTGTGVGDGQYDRVREDMYSYMLPLANATYFSSINLRRQAATAARRSRLMGMTCRRDGKAAPLIRWRKGV